MQHVRPVKLWKTNTTFKQSCVLTFVYTAIQVCVQSSLHDCCVSCSSNYLKSQLEFNCRLHIPQYYGSHCRRRDWRIL